eukprot:Gb_24704 [translate_table: standard]
MFLLNCRSRGAYLGVACASSFFYLMNPAFSIRRSWLVRSCGGPQCFRLNLSALFAVFCSEQYERVSCVRGPCCSF